MLTGIRAIRPNGTTTRSRQFRAGGVLDWRDVGYAAPMSVSEAETALDVSYPAQPSQIPAIRRAVVDVARCFGADDAALLHINLAVSEAATNAILHAYRERAEEQGAGDVRVIVRGDDAQGLCVHVRDGGRGLVPRSDSPGMGLGLCLMAHETDRFEIRRAPEGGTEVVLHFRL